ncbi:MAG: SIMPL domain-containing protein [Lysobacter sp.]|nr:SIMPL domain-containing protein [Lysobacter sp.]
MLPREDRHTLPAALVLALGLAVGLAGGGWLVGHGLARFKSETRTVTVKGLVEREVKSDRAVWTLGLRRASDTLADAHQRIAADRDAVLAFLGKQGFAGAEIDRQPTRTLERNARAIAEQFAADSGSKVGDIRSANQGSIQIYGTDGNDESAPFAPTSTPVKKIRVVSTLEFALK